MADSKPTPDPDEKAPLTNETQQSDAPPARSGPESGSSKATLALLKHKRPFVEKAIQALEDSGPVIVTEPQSNAVQKQQGPPWTLQQYFNGEIDLGLELAARFSSTPLMSAFKARSLGTRTGRNVATLGAQDGSAQIVFDIDTQTKEIQVSFTFGSMLTLRFFLVDLVDRKRWLELMRRDEGGLAFLWGPSRWENDYVICMARRYFTNFYAFSPRGFEASVRMTPQVTEQLVNWLEKNWQADGSEDDGPPPMLTW